MCGSEAKTIDDPEVILGLSPSTLPEPHLAQRLRPSAALGIASLVTPIVAVGIAWTIVALPSTYRTSPDFTPLLWILGLLALASIAGTVLSICSLWKRERWPILAIIGLMLNGGCLLNGLQSVLRF